MKTIYTLVFLVSMLSFSETMLSQNIVIDSLKNELLLHTKKDDTRVNILNELAYNIYEIDINISKTYLDKAEAILKTIDYKKGAARNLFLKGSLGLRQGDYKNAIGYVEKSIEIREEIGKHKGLPEELNLLGLLHLKVGNYSKSLEYHKRSLKLFEDQNNQEGISSSLESIGDIYKRQGNYPLALDYLNKALFLKEKQSDSAEVYSILNTIGVIYEREGYPDKSLEYYNRALNINTKNNNKKGLSRTNIGIGTLYISKKEFAKAFIYLNRALEVNEEISDLDMVAVCLNYIGFIYLQQGKLTLALDCYKKSERISLKTGNQSALSKAYRGLANVLLVEKKYNEALSYALKSKEIADKLNSLSHQIDAEYLLYNIYKSNKNYEKALKSHEAYKRVNDSLFNKENIQKITQLEYEYKYKQALDSASIRELQLTKTVTATNKDLEKSKQNYLWAIIGILLVSMLLGGVIFYQKYKNIKSKAQNIVIEQKLLRSQMTPHFIFNSLSVLQGMILNKEEEKSIYYLTKFSKLLRITLENSRDKTVSLSEELLAIQNYLALQNLENEAYEYTILVEDTIDVPLFEIPPMLIQPFVENALEHAFVNQKEKRTIAIRLTYIDKQLICTILDNGIGIEATKETKNQHKISLATTITTDRLKILSKDLKMKGSITIEDRKKYNEQGTIVTIVIPHIIH